MIKIKFCPECNAKTTGDKMHWMVGNQNGWQSEVKYVLCKKHKGVRLANEN